MKRILFLCGFFLSCTVNPVFIPQAPLMKPSRDIILPTKPSSMPLPSTVEPEEWVMPIEKGFCSQQPVTTKCPAHSGFIESEAHAIKDYQYRISYDELRALYEYDVDLWIIKEDIYQTLIEQYEKELELRQPTWIEQNQLWLGIAGGLMLGVTMSSIIIKSSKK